jgi:hypothetical protein
MPHEGTLAAGGGEELRMTRYVFVAGVLLISCDKLRFLVLSGRVVV